MRRISPIVWGLFATLLVSPFASTAHADPCGMIPPPPPPYLQKTTLIERVGAQKTYVFYKNGIESFVLRPGFKGKVSNFGMLIPFPSPPAIRKVPNEIFSHLAAAVDPPEVVVRVSRSRRFGGGMRGLARPTAAPSRSRSADAGRLQINQVRVVRQEAVGMYQVAVLQAGSPKALKRWMKNNGYMYPKGMDKVCYEYIRARWTFVAVKARVAGKKGVSPRPGMRNVKTAFPKGGSFSGKVQAMGFRFRSKRLVVPMRLSAFNKGKLRNIVYLLTTSPKRIRRIPKKYVMRQMRGKVLFRNITEPLPLRIHGGTVSMINKWRWVQAQRLRNPAPHNGHAKDLFASDLLAARRGRLSLRHEREKKVLLRIGERLRLRSKHLDKLNRQVLKSHRDRAVKIALRDLRAMTLTVIDGDFKREVIAAENLTFATYRMPRKCNSNRYYNARTLARIGCGTKGRRTWGKKFAKRGPHFKSWNKPLVQKKRRRTKRTSRYYFRMIKRLSSAKRANRTVAKLVSEGQKAVPYLLGEAIEGNKWVRRGWSLVALSSIEGSNVSKGLLDMTKDPKQHLLLRNWSAAAFLKRANTSKEMLQAMRFASAMPALKRPFRMRITDLIRKHPNPAQLLFTMAAKNSRVHQWVRPLLTAQSAKSTLAQMLSNKHMGARRTAASYAAVHMRKDSMATTKAFLHLMQAKSGASQVPWAGGPLYMPSWPTVQLPRFPTWTWQNRIRQFGMRAIQDNTPQKLKALAEQIASARKEWNIKVRLKQESNKELKANSRKMIHNLLAWAIWSDKRNKPKELRKILINLRSIQLTRGAVIGRLNNQATLMTWLLHWQKSVGQSEYKRLLRAAGVQGDPMYTSAGIAQRIKRAARKWKNFMSKIYLGCFRDNYRRRDLANHGGYTYSVPVCRKICAQRGYRYAGLQHGYQCFCGNQFGRHGKGSERICSRTCSRSRRYKCGGSYYNSIYTAKGPTQP